MIFLIFISMVAILFCLAVFQWAALRPPALLFGIHVEPDYSLGSGQRLLRTFRISLLILGVLAIGLSLLFIVQGQVLGAVFLYIAFLASSLGIFLLAARQAKQHQTKRQDGVIGLSLRPRQASDFRLWSVEIISWALVLGAIVLAAVSYKDLPARLPVHWDLKGHVNGWAVKSLYSVFVLPCIALSVLGLFALIERDLPLTKIAPPAGDAGEIYLANKTALIRILFRIVEWTGLLVAILFSFIKVFQILSVTGHIPSDLQWGFPSILLVPILGFGWLIIELNRRIVKLTDALGETLGRQNLSITTHEEKWRGENIYSNPDDAAFFVEKRIGVGVAINWAHRRAIWYGLSLTVLIALITVAVIK